MKEFYDGLVNEDITKMSSLTQKNFAEQFAEGNLGLKNLLLYLWRNGIQTIASCGGHGESEKPYISIKFDGISRCSQKRLLNQIMLVIEQSDIFNDLTFQLDEIFCGERHIFSVHLDNANGFVVLNEIDKYMRKNNIYQGDLC